MADMIPDALQDLEERCSTAQKALRKMPSISLRSEGLMDSQPSLDPTLRERWSEAHAYASREVLSGMTEGLSRVLDVCDEWFDIKLRDTPLWPPFPDPTVSKDYLRYLVDDTKSKVSNLHQAIQNEDWEKVPRSILDLRKRLARLELQAEVLDRASQYDSSFDQDAQFAAYKHAHAQAWESLPLDEQVRINLHIPEAEHSAQKEMSKVLPDPTKLELKTDDDQIECSSEVNLLVLGNWGTWLQTSRAYRESITSDFAAKSKVVVEF